MRRLLVSLVLSFCFVVAAFETAQAQGSLNQACKTGNVCNTGLTCVNGKCVAPVVAPTVAPVTTSPAGGVNQDCKSGNVCNTGLSCVSGKCVAPAPVVGTTSANAVATGPGTNGKPCRPRVDGPGQPCDAGLICYLGKVCEPDHAGILNMPCHADGTCNSSPTPGQKWVCNSGKCVIFVPSCANTPALCGPCHQACGSGYVCGEVNGTPKCVPSSDSAPQ